MIAIFLDKAEQNIVERRGLRDAQQLPDPSELCVCQRQLLSVEDEMCRAVLPVTGPQVARHAQKLHVVGETSDHLSDNGDSLLQLISCFGIAG